MRGAGWRFGLGEAWAPLWPQEADVLSEPLSSTQRKREAKLTPQGRDLPGGVLLSPVIPSLLHLDRMVPQVALLGLNHSLGTIQSLALDIWHFFGSSSQSVIVPILQMGKLSDLPKATQPVGGITADRLRLRVWAEVDVLSVPTPRLLSLVAGFLSFSI